MTGADKEVIERLTRIETTLGEIEKALKRDYTVLHGNGQPGLLTRVANLEVNWKWAKWLAGAIGAVAGYVAAFFTKN